MSNEKNSQNKSGELKKPPYVTRTNQPWTTVFAEDLNKKKEEDTPAETKLDLSQFVKVEKVQDDKSTTIPAPVSEAKKDKADTVNKGNVQNVTPIPTPEHKFRPKDSSQQSKPSDEFETKPVMEAAPPLRKSLSLNPKAISRMMTATLLSLLRLVDSRIRMQMKNWKRNRRKNLKRKIPRKKLLSLKWLLSPTKAAMSFWVSAV